MATVPLIAIVRLPDVDATVSAASAVHAGGVRAIEVAPAGDGTLDKVNALRNGGLDGLCVGVGPVRTVRDARRAIDAGAEYLVTPTTNPDVVAESRWYDVPIVCGGLTPSELDAANRAGADYMMIFPASTVGPRYLREILAPMPDLRIVAAGGVDVDNIGEYRAAGAVGAGIGHALVDRDTVAAKDWNTLEKRAAALVAAWHEGS